jgi:hypothetical protein
LNYRDTDPEIAKTFSRSKTDTVPIDLEGISRLTSPTAWHASTSREMGK